MRGAAIAQPVSTIARTNVGNASTPVQSPGTTVAGPSAGLTNAVAGGVPAPASPARRAGPAVVPAPASQPVPSQPTPVSQPNLMQKFSEMTAPGGDILSKGKELIFMKFGLGGK